MFDFLKAHWAEIGAFLWLVSEALSLFPGIKANGVFQLIYNGIRKYFPQPQIAPPKP